jgi:hypothetical protein
MNMKPIFVILHLPALVVGFLFEVCVTGFEAGRIAAVGASERLLGDA